MAYPQSAVERAMKVQEVIVRALAGKLTWPQAADILGRSPRSIRRLRWRLQHFGYDGLFDRRRQFCEIYRRWLGRRGLSVAAHAAARDSQRAACETLKGGRSGLAPGPDHP